MIICIIGFRNDSEKTIQYTRQVNPTGKSKREIINALTENIYYEMKNGSEFIVVRIIPADTKLKELLADSGITVLDR